MLEVYKLDELPLAENGMKYFACIGGSKNYQCFLESVKLSRADFMKKYENCLDLCHQPIYTDDDITIRQDAQIPIPGFFVVATKGNYKKISYMSLELYQKCLYYSSLLRKNLYNEFGIDKVYMYYDEHYNKPSSTHFWVMPIYNNIIETNSLDPTIFKYDIWKYQELFEFRNSKDEIYKINSRMRKILER